MLFLGIDFGGGSSKATLINEKGKVIKTASSEYATKYASDGTATQNPKDWYQAALANIKSILSSGVKAEDIECICFDAATHTAVLLDENGEVLADSIYWTDTRSVKEKQYLLDNYSEYIFEKCKHLPDTIWTLPELMYLFKIRPDLKEKVAHVVFAKDYVRHQFAPGYITDYIEAEGSMLYDFENGCWDETLLKLAGLNKEQMPLVLSPLSQVGYISQKASEESGLSTKTKVICGTTDTAMEVFAAGGSKNGDMTLKLATAGRICLVTDQMHPDKNIINYSHINEGLFYPGSGTKSCAASLRWFRDTFGGDYKEYDESIANIPLGSDGLFFHPYLMGELTPLANPNIRGSYFGVSSLHTKAHFIKALYEGVAYSLLDCYKYLKKKGLPVPKKAYVLGGGAKSPVWRQIIADVLGITLVVTENNDSSFGGAICAAISSGVYKNIEEASKKTLKIKCYTRPNRENHKRYQTLYKKYNEITKFIVKFYGK